MRITKLIDELGVIRDEHGEVEVIGYDETCDCDVDITGVEHNNDDVVKPVALLTFRPIAPGEAD